MSKLTTVFFKKDKDPGYIKAIIDVEEIPFFVELGAKQTVTELQAVQIKAPESATNKNPNTEGPKAKGSKANG